MTRDAGGKSAIAKKVAEIAAEKGPTTHRHLLLLQNITDPETLKIVLSRR